MRTLTQQISFVLVLALLLVMMAETARGGTVLRVGTGTGCDHSTIQGAMDSTTPGSSVTLRVNTGYYGESVTIVNRSVDLTGGYAGCTASSPDSFSTIDATGSNKTALSFQVTDGVHSLSLTNMDLINGTGTSSVVPGGGLSVLTADTDNTANVSLFSTWVWANTTEYAGGGIAVTGGGDGSLSLDSKSSIRSNSVTGTTPRGGGLYCEGNYQISMTGGSIFSNTAGEEGGTNATGGGIHLRGCEMLWLSHIPTGAAGDDASLSYNTVYGRGAGLYAISGAQVNLIGADFVLLGDPSSSRPLGIHNNTAENGGSVSVGDGSAVYAWGTGTQVVFDRTWTYANEAAGTGTFRAVNGAEIIVERGSEVCHTPRNCSRVFDNSAANRVGAMATDEGTAIRFRRTIVSANSHIDSSFFTSIFESQLGGIVEIDDSLVFGNSADWGIVTWATDSRLPVMRVRRSTITGNDFSREVFAIREDNSSFDLYDSIVHEPGTSMAFIEDSPNIRVDCVVWHDDQLADFEDTPGDDRTMVADPKFWKPAQGLYYLQPGSPAINYCNVISGTEDLDWNPRGETHGQPVLHGPFDLGAYEILPVIFDDRFEMP